MQAQAATDPQQGDTKQVWRTSVAAATMKHIFDCTLDATGRHSHPVAAGHQAASPRPRLQTRAFMSSTGKHLPFAGARWKKRFVLTVEMHLSLRPATLAGRHRRQKAACGRLGRVRERPGEPRRL